MNEQVVLVCVQVFLLVLTVRKWVAEDKFSKTIEAVEGGKQPKYCKALLNSWDFYIISKEQVSDLKKSIGEQIKLAIEEEKLQETLRKRTKKEKYILIGRRFVAFLLYCILQASSWYVIIVLTTQSSNMQRHLAEKIPFLSNYVASIVPAVVTVINSTLPTIISFLTKMEKWDDVGFGIKAMVTRLFLAKILNILIQLFSFALLLDPFLFASKFDFFGFEMQFVSIRKNVMVEFKNFDFQCRAEQVASGLLTLVVTDFLVSKIMAIVPPILKWAQKAVQILIVQPWREKKKTNNKKNSNKVSPVAAFDSDSANNTNILSSVQKKENDDGTPFNNDSTAAVGVLAPGSVKPEINFNETTQQQKELTNTTLQTLSQKPIKNQQISTAVVIAPEEAVEMPNTSSSSTTKKQLFRQIFEPFDQKDRREFLVPEKMVALFYSITITLIAIPLAPGTALVSLLLLVSTFKFDKIILMVSIILRIYSSHKPCTHSLCLISTCYLLHSMQ
jgi:hypothetical protein